MLALLLRRKPMPRTKLISHRRNLPQEQNRTSGKALVGRVFLNPRPLEPFLMFLFGIKTPRLGVLQVERLKGQMGPLRETEYSCAVKLRRRKLREQSARCSSTRNNRRDSAMSRLTILGVKLYCRWSILFPTHVAARHFDDIGIMGAQHQNSAISHEKLSPSVKKQTSLPSYLASRGLTHDQMTQQKIREDNRGNKDLQGRNGLPDIHSTEGKPLVQLRQPSMTSISNVSIRSRATLVFVADTLSFDHVGDD